MKKKFIFIIMATTLFFSQSLTVFAVSASDVEAVGKETASANVFIWFLCAIAFLKVSQKIDSFLGALGINVGHTGGSMMAELMIAARGISTAKSFATGGLFSGGSSKGTTASSGAPFMSGGLAGIVGRQFTQRAMGAMTGQANNPISRKAFESSLKNGGDFANNVTGAIAKGNINYTGSMTGPQAADALYSYLKDTNLDDDVTFSNVEIGGGRIMGTERSVFEPFGISFGMYSADQYMEPEGSFETITAADNSIWYKQYATDAVERTPYMTGDGKIAYHESIVQKLPNMPKRKDRV